MDLYNASTLNEGQEMISTKVENKVAYISELPEDILSLILSYLTVRDCTTLRVLSQRWRHLSSFTPDLQFDEFTVLGVKMPLRSSPQWKSWKFGIYDKQRMLRFVTAVDHFLQQYNGRKMHSLTVRYFLENEFASYIDRWIAFAIGLGIQRLKIDLSLVAVCQYIVLPKDYDYYLFSCHLLSKASHLEHLSLHICKLTGTKVFPCLELKTRSLNALRTINLRRVNLLDDQNGLNTILSCCKKLEYLRLHRCLLPKSLSLCGSPPRTEPPDSEPYLSLKSLVIKDCYEGRKISISSILLGCLELDSRDCMFLKFAGVSTMMEKMHLFVRYRFQNGFSKYLPRLQYLYLKMFSHDKDVPIPIPANLNKLKQLKELKIWFGYFANTFSDFDLLSLARMLNVCPHLQKFHLEIYRPYRDTFDGDEEMVSWSYNEQKYHHLTEVAISGFCGDGSGDLALAIYLLRNAVRLEQMIIDLWRDPFYREPFCRPTSEELEKFRAAEELEMKRVHDVLSDENPNVRVIVRDSSYSLLIPQITADLEAGTGFAPMRND